MKRTDIVEAPGLRRGSGRALGYPEKSRSRAERVARAELTTPDVVLLSLLAERPMHGYQANAELERREIRDWANVSLPQVYYSLKKLRHEGLIRASETSEPLDGPERSTFETAEKGREALADALEQEAWTTQRERPPFLTSMTLSWPPPPGTSLQPFTPPHQFLL